MTTNKNTYYINGIKDRDRRILKEIYENILPGITNWVKENGGQKVDAEDLFQEMIVSIYKKIIDGNFELSCTFWSYALIVCRNLWFAKNRNKYKMVYSDTIEGENITIGAGMQEEIEDQEKNLLYRKHFNALGENCQKILSMFFAKVKMEEIAEKLKMSAGYIKKRKFLCKEELIANIQADPLFEELSA